MFFDLFVFAFSFSACGTWVEWGAGGGRGAAGSSGGVEAAGRGGSRGPSLYAQVGFIYMLYDTNLI